MKEVTTTAKYNTPSGVGFKGLAPPKEEPDAAKFRFKQFSPWGIGGPHAQAEVSYELHVTDAVCAVHSLTGTENSMDRSEGCRTRAYPFARARNEYSLAGRSASIFHDSLDNSRSLVD